MIVLDAGALVALERNDRAMWAVLREALYADIKPLLPMAALAQVWRGGRRQDKLAMVIADVDRVSFDDMAKQVGELCGKARTSDVVDASVALVAARPGVTALYTSDPDDLARLIRHAGRASGPRITRC